MALKVKFTGTVEGTTSELAYETEAGAVQDLDDYVGEAASSHTSAAAIASPNPSYFERYYIMEPNHTTITIPAGMSLKVNGHGFAVTSDVTLNVADLGAATARAGKDVYVYAVINTVNNNSQLGFVLSLNSTVPAGYTSETSRKIGGFHCLCAGVGTITDHPLSGYAAGDIIPASVWDLKHRPHSNPEGMVYDANLRKWVDIYLCSYDSSDGLVSVYGGVIADGTSSVKFHAMKFGQYLNQVKKRMPNLYEFMSFSHGSNQGTNIAGSADANTTGGHNDTGDRRMISDIGCEDCCGTMGQWSRDRGGPYGEAKWVNNYDANDDSDIKGSGYNQPNCELLGGNWDSSSSCGSRCSYWNVGPLGLVAYYGVRGISDPKIC